MGTTYTNPDTSLPVEYAHTIEYFQKGVDADGPFYRVQYLIDNWTDSDNFINALMGFTRNSGGASGSTTRQSPHRHPLANNLYCHSAVAVQGLGDVTKNTAGYPSYAGGALIQAEYRAIVSQDFVQSPEMLNQQIDPATPLLWCTQELEYTSEFITIKNSKVTYTAGPAGITGTPVLDLAYRIRVPITIMSLTFHLVPYMPTATIRNLQGYVNNAQFMGCKAGTVYFSGARVTRQVNNDGTIAQQIQLTFMQRTGVKSASAGTGATDQLWNSLPHPDNLNWYPVAGNGASANTLYPTGDFSPLVAF